MVQGFPEETMPTHYIVADQTLILPEVFIIDADGNITTKAVTDKKLGESRPIRFEVKQLVVLDLVEQVNPGRN